MLHAPASPLRPDPAFAFKRRLGAILFVIYALVYAGFVAVNLVRPRLMERAVLGGLNLAVIYGMGLIIFALLLALVYNRACGRRERALRGTPEGKA
jgi:uncharacterized membrane protein (DUF485 family)